MRLEMPKWFITGSARFYRFCLDNAGIWVFYSIVMALPNLFRARVGESIGIAEKWMAWGFLASLPFALVLVGSIALLYYWNRILGRVLKYAITALLSIISVVEIWLTFIQHTRWSDRILTFIFGTSTQESKDFFRLYVFSSKSLLVLFCCLIGLTGLYYLLPYIAKIVKEKLITASRGIKISVLVGMILSVILGIVENFLFFLGPNIMNLSHLNSPTSLGRAIKVYSWNFRKIKELEKTVNTVDGYVKNRADMPDKIVWVIGESDPVTHSSLYGYDHATNPVMQEELKKGNLLLYDAVAYMPSTQNTIGIVYSPYIRGQVSPKFEDTPLTPMILRHAGYHVNLHDNQATLTRGDHPFELGTGFFLNSLVLNRASFDYRNETLEIFDFDFVKGEGDKFLKDTSTPSVEIYHINGQHFEASSHYPEDKAYFKPSDYSGKIVYGQPATEEMKEYFAHHDNATRYMDSSLAWITRQLKDEDAIMIYHSDHGENIYDTGDDAFRTMDYGHSKALAEVLLRVPFYVYTTPKFRQKHPELYKRLVTATQRKISLLYFSHFLLDVAGVESKWKRQDLSPLSEKWSNPPRYVGGEGFEMRDFDKWK